MAEGSVAKDVVISLKAKNEASPAFESLAKTVKRAKDEVKVLDKEMLSAGKATKLVMQALANTDDVQKRMRALADAVKRLGLNARETASAAAEMGRQFRLSGDQVKQSLAFAQQSRSMWTRPIFGTGASLTAEGAGGGIGASTAGIGGFMAGRFGLAKGGLAAAAGYLGYRAIADIPLAAEQSRLNRAGGWSHEDPEGSMGATISKYGGEFANIFTGRLTEERRRQRAMNSGLINQQSVDVAQATLAGNDIGARLRQRGMAAQAGGLGMGVFADQYALSGRGQFVDRFGTGAASGLAGGQAQTVVAATELATITKDRLAAQQRLDESIRNEPLLLLKRNQLQRELNVLLDQEFAGRMKLGSALREQAQAYRNISIQESQKIEGVKAQFGLMTPSQRLATVQAVRQVYKHGLGTGTPSRMQLNPMTGSMERVPGTGTALSPERLALVQAVAPDLLEKAARKVGGASPMWAELQEMIGERKRGADAAAQAIDLKLNNMIEIKIDMQAEAVEKQLTDALVPKLHDVITQAMDKLKESLRTELLISDRDARINRINAATGGGGH